MNVAAQAGSLRSSLKYEPRELEFGTSGRRGKVVDLTQLEVYINALAELEYLQSLDTSEGGVVRGQEFFFARKNAAGIDLGAAERNYTDENHKPEMAVALTDFWMLHGFRPLDQIAEALSRVPELCSIMPDFSVRLARAGDATQARRDLLRDLYCAVMTMPQERGGPSSECTR